MSEEILAWGGTRIRRGHVGFRQRNLKRKDSAGCKRATARVAGDEAELAVVIPSVDRALLTLANSVAITALYSVTL